MTAPHDKLAAGGLVTDLMRIVLFCGVAIGAAIMGVAWIAVTILERIA